MCPLCLCCFVFNYVSVGVFVYVDLYVFTVSVCVFVYVDVYVFTVSVCVCVCMCLLSLLLQIFVGRRGSLRRLHQSVVLMQLRVRPATSFPVCCFVGVTVFVCVVCLERC
jgi:hypothetical protein